MKPEALIPTNFAGYAPSSRALAFAHLKLLQAMPISVLPSFLEQIQSLPFLFPVEQAALRRKLDFLSAASPTQQAALFGSFATITVSPQLAETDWVNHPALFVKSLSAYLWQSRQIDAYHKAANTLFAAFPGPSAHRPTPPLLISVLGQNAAASSYSLFTKLRSHGLYLRQIKQDNALAALAALLSSRSQKHTEPYAHWYVDGGPPLTLPPQTPLTAFNYPQLAPITQAVLRAMDRAVKEGTGPELLQRTLGQMEPATLGASAITNDPLLQHFYVRLLTEHSGTQIYSTSFVQAAGVALLRRAQPLTLYMRFAPRRKPASMNEMIEQQGLSTATDADGALIDADMATYYAWLALRDLPHGEQATLIAYVEDRGEMFLAGPGVTHNAESTTPMTIAQALATLSL